MKSNTCLPMRVSQISKLPGDIGLPLASLDQRLCRAASAARIPLLEE